MWTSLFGAFSNGAWCNRSGTGFNRRNTRERGMDGLTWFGLFAVSAMLIAYALEDRSPWFVLAFAVACALASTYGFLQGAWPFGVVEGVWTVVALRRFMLRRGAAA